jgi:hypothetical protein
LLSIIRCFSHLVLQNVITGSEDDNTIIVTGNVEFKETITVTKKKGNETDHEKMEKYFFEVRVGLGK